MAKNLFHFTRDTRGNIKKQLGKKWNDTGDNIVWATFYFLGLTEAQATLRIVKLVSLWEQVGKLWYQDGSPDKSPCPLWDDTTMRIAQAVCKGEDSVTVPYPLDVTNPACHEPAFAQTVKLWYARLQSQFAAFVTVTPEQSELMECLDQQLATEAKLHKLTAEHHEELAQLHAAKAKAERSHAAVAKSLETLVIIKPDGAQADNGPTLAQALDAYEAARTAHFHDRPASARTVRNRVKLFKKHLEKQGHLQTPLPHVHNTFIQQWIDYWVRRPITAHGSPLSPDMAKEMVKMIRAFVLWLDESELFSWDLPPKYRVRRVKIKRGKKTPVVRYELAELVKLWQAAKPHQRLWILLALNCGFGRAELSSFRRDEVNLTTGRTERLRTKTDVEGRWELWTETVNAIRWYVDKVRPASDSPFLILDDDGIDLLRPTDGGNQNSTVSNQWARLIQFIQKDEPAFPVRTYNKLRKTGASWVRDRYGDDLAELYLSHGPEKILNAYADVPYHKLFPILQTFRKWLQPVFDAVADPFPDSGTTKNRSLSLGTRERIKALSGQGQTVKAIAEELGVTREAVARVLKS